MTGSLLTRSLVGRLWISVVTLARGTSCTGYMSLHVLKWNLLISGICVGGRCLYTLCLVVLTSCITSQMVLHWTVRVIRWCPSTMLCISTLWNRIFINMSLFMSGCQRWISRVCVLRRGPLFSRIWDWLYLSCTPYRWCGPCFEP